MEIFDKFKKKELFDKKKSLDWGVYIDINRRLLISLKKINTYIVEINSNSDLTEKEVFSMTHYLTSIYGGGLESKDKSFSLTSSFGNSKKIYETLKYNSKEIKNILSGSADDDNLGLIQLTENEIKQVENFIQTNPSLTPAVEAQILDLSEKFNSKRARLLTSLNELMARESQESFELINYSTKSTDDILDSLGKHFRYTVDFIKKESGDENIFAHLLEIANILDYYINSPKSQELLFNGIPSQPLKCYVHNYLERFKRPIKERVVEIKDLLDKNNNTLLTLDEESKDKLYNFYDEILEKIFDCEDKSVIDAIKSKKAKLKSNTIIKEFTSLVEKLKIYLTEEKKYPLKPDEIFSMVIYEKKSISSKFKFFSGKTINEFITIGNIFEKIKKSPKDLDKFLEESNKAIELILDGKTSFNEFIKLQKDNSIASSRDTQKVNNLVKNYWEEHGYNIEQRYLALDGVYQNVDLHFRTEYDLETMYVGALATTFKNITNIINNDGTLGDFKTDIQLFTKTLTDLSNKFSTNKEDLTRQKELAQNKVNTISAILEEKQKRAKNIEYQISIIQNNINNLQSQKHDPVYETQSNGMGKNRTESNTPRYRNPSEISQIDASINTQTQDLESLKSEFAELNNGRSTTTKDEEKGIIVLVKELAEQEGILTKLQNNLQALETWAEPIKQIQQLIKDTLFFITSINDSMESIKAKYLDPIHEITGKNYKLIWMELNNNFTYRGQESSNSTGSTPPENSYPRLS